jgi:hypothetical protein
MTFLLVSHAVSYKAATIWVAAIGEEGVPGHHRAP